MKDKFLAMTGMAKRAGKLISGEALCKDALRKGRAKLVILAEDASPNTKKSITNSCNYYKVECIVYGTVDSLGHCTGAGSRAVAAVTDENFSRSLKTIFEKVHNEERVM
ncbi:MAG: ribosomal L7Ae/L30e/S12e/Gadd45 family protein [Clostridiales bacterium]|nr:ribosomal L7Ae/L30e/S12e/Gadd45 family protein [Clostridiales bacterium]